VEGRVKEDGAGSGTIASGDGEECEGRWGVRRPESGVRDIGQKLDKQNRHPDEAVFVNLQRLIYHQLYNSRLTTMTHYQSRLTS
jgi:hypothetical protein